MKGVIVLHSERREAVPKNDQIIARPPGEALSSSGTRSAQMCRLSVNVSISSCATIEIPVKLAQDALFVHELSTQFAKYVIKLAPLADLSLNGNSSVC